MDEDVFEELIKELNPFEIIFKPYQIALNMQP
jgi:hypothetical protein